MLPIFDSLAHPTLSGSWLGRPVRADFESLANDLNGAGYMGACAIGLDEHQKTIPMSYSSRVAATIPA